MRKPTAILLVDDDPDTVELISHAIREHDAGAVIHSCAAIADLAPIDLDELDLVLCDFHLPDGRAVDAIRILLERRDDLPIVIVTGERETAAVVEAIHQGAVDYIVKFGDYLRMIPIVIAKNLAAARLRRDNLRLQSALASSLAELKAKNRTLEQLAARLEVMASTDLLTQLDNRRRMDERLSVMFSEAVRYNRELTCMMVDLDEFKSVNDVLGHQTGDELLAITGRVIRDEIRASDIGARYGGDEFLLALPNTTHTTAAMLAKRLRASFHRAINERFGKEVNCSMSVGIASLLLSRPMSPQQIIAQADAALYAAKRAPGDTRVMICTPDGNSAQPADSVAA